MHNGKSFLAIIPARGGSKRLPRKNLLDLAGKPLIGWSIAAARECQYIDEVMVTTDDAEISNVARLYGANVPFVRPAELATDTSSSFDAIKHAIEHYRTQLDKRFEFIVLLQPTSPLRSSDEITAAIELLEKKKADAIVSVCEVDHSPLWMNKLPADLSMDNFIHDEVKNIRSQDLPTYYRLNGAIYICSTERLLAEKTFFLSSGIYAHLMSREASVDIDDAVDFNLALVYMARKNHVNVAVRDGS